MDFSVLGPLQVGVSGQVVPIRRGLPRTLLIYLLLRAGQPVAVPVLADRLWAGTPPPDPANAVHRVVSYVRRALGGRADLPLHTTAAGYVMEVPAGHVDAARFRRLVGEAAGRVDGDIGPVPAIAPRVAHDVLTAVDTALLLWRGEPLADVAEHEWAAAEITRLLETQVQAQELRMAALLALDRHREAVAEARAAVTAHPLRESLHGLLALALYRSDRQSDALAVIAALRSRLRDELGLDPGPTLADLEQRVLRHDYSLRPPAVTAPAPAPPRVSPPTSPSQTRPVPRAVTSLVGREADLDDIAGALARASLVTLTGTGGVGKTRLALAVLDRLAIPRVWFTDLSGVPDDDAVPHAVAATVGAPTAPGRDVVDAVVAHLSHGSEPDGLLVLDTCEHVVAAVATLAHRVLHECPHIRLLATSRRPLGVAGEAVRPVPSLAPAAAAELFAQRATSVLPTFDPHDGADDVAAICRALDGLPLAIELAAAHTDVLSPAAIRRRLDDRFALLVADTRDAATRQRTLRGTIDSSVALLTTAERRAFARLGVFAGTFDLDAAMAITGEPESGAEPFRLLASLVRQSLVARVGPERYRLLDSTRAYASEVLGRSADANKVRRRHAEHHTALAEDADLQVRTAGQQTWLPLLRATLPDLRAALSWCLDGADRRLGARLAGALAWFWTLEGMLAEGSGWLDRAEQVDLTDPRERSRVLLGVGLLAAPLGDLARAREACAEAARISSDAGDDRGTGDALITLGVAHWGLGELAAAAAAHDEAAARLAVAGDLWRRGVVTVLRTRTAVDRGERDAGDRVMVAVALARRVGDAHLLGLALTQQSRLALSVGGRAEAVEAARHALGLNRRIGYREGEAAALTLLSRALTVTTSRPPPSAALDEAEDAATEAVRLAAAIGHQGAVCQALEALAAVRAATEDARDALMLLELAAAARCASGIAEPSLEALVTRRVRANVLVALGAEAEQVCAHAAAVSLDDVISATRLDGRIRTTT